MRVAVDTNAALLPFSQNIDLRSEIENAIGHHELLLPLSCKLELEHLAEGNTAPARHARAALRMFGSTPILRTDAPGDEGVIRLMQNRAFEYVVTNDKKMIGEAKRYGIGVISTRGGTKLELRLRPQSLG